MSIWYEVSKWNWQIVEREVEKESEVSVWIGGRRRAKETYYDQLFPSLSEAKACLRRRAEREVERLRRELTYAEEALKNNA